MSLPDGPDHALLLLEQSNYERHCGVRPVVVDVGGGAAGVRYPTSETSASLGALRAVPAEILERRAHRDAIRGLGFGIDPDGLLRTVPTPRTFRERAARRGVVPGVLPVLRSIRGAQQGPAWTQALLAGEFVVGVPTSWTLRVPFVRVPVSTMAHDLGFHCLPLHWVTAADWSRLGEALAESPGSRVPSSAELTRWLEGPLTNACWELWAETDSPRDVPGVLAAAWPALSRALEPGSGSLS
jgi:hypothetical protein